MSGDRKRKKKEDIWLNITGASLDDIIKASVSTPVMKSITISDFEEHEIENAAGKTVTITGIIGQPNMVKIIELREFDGQTSKYHPLLITIDPYQKTGTTILIQRQPIKVLSGHKLYIKLKNDSITESFAAVLYMEYQDN